jgi:release factor glutamine methyltransferase
MQALRLIQNEICQQLPEAEARLILFYAIRKSGVDLKGLSDLNGDLNPDTKNIDFDHLLPEIQSIVTQRLSGLPLQHIIGKQFFYEHEYTVSPDVLIPRPETEILVEEIISYLNKKIVEGTVQPSFRFAELGLGSGVISCEILSAFPSSHSTASEASLSAQTIAKINLETIVGPLYKNRISILSAEQSSAFEIFKGQQFDLIVSNPPYLSVHDEIETDVIQHEPYLALFPFNHPNYFYENFSECGLSLLKSGGAAFFEIPHERADSIQSLFNPKHFTSEIISDLTGRPRVLKLTKE